MPTPFLSVIIPTLNRCETLRFTISTTLSETVADYEIIVSDNCSEDETKEVALSFNDNRIVYVRTAKRVNMADNWEFALKHARGKFVMFIGDDDALMPLALPTLRRLIATGDFDVFTWRQHGYTWPTRSIPAKVRSIEAVRAAESLDLNFICRRSISFGGSFLSRLPMVYHSAVNREIIDRIKSKLGRFFCTEVPDIFSGFVIPVYTDRAINIGVPLTVNGWSEKSNSYTMRTPGGMERLVNNLKSDEAKSNVHASLVKSPDFDFINMHITPILTAIDLFPSYYKDVKFNYSAMWAMYNKNCRFRNTFKIIFISNLISRCHEFSVVHFLFYSLLHFIGVLFGSMRRAVRGKRPVESNIRDFAAGIDARVG